ncbi:hypothetical protein J2W42_005223 [Rhizobium tibeticum]|uniref:hypothetical protein n=1 Tax=Rhizobium tibeticum TaxID=501024 RepID=UPI0027890239|nr:hypothetical protein [Rhizobium tibeticum]MDP9812353.1 hypothetical protein [Rhizobium tibeticum]
MGETETQSRTPLPCDDNANAARLATGLVTRGRLALPQVAQAQALSALANILETDHKFLMDFFGSTHQAVCNDVGTTNQLAVLVGGQNDELVFTALRFPSKRASYLRKELLHCQASH